MKRKVAVITMAYNESYFLPLWLRHYGRSFPDSQLYVIDDGSDDGSTDGLGRVNVIRLPRKPFDDVRRAKLVSEIASSLLAWYDTVIYTDCDELLVPDPEVAPDLQSFCDGVEEEVVTAIGLNLEQMEEEPSPPAAALPLLQARRYARFVHAMCKPVMTRVPIRWDPGFHGSDQPMRFAGLFLFHLRHHDLRVALRRLAKTRSMEWASKEHDHYQRWEDAQYQGMVRAVRGMERQEETSFLPGDPAIWPHLERALEQAAKGPQEKRRFYMDVPPPPNLLLRVPERFADALPPAATLRAPVAGTQSPGGEVTAGRDGWLFLTGGTNDTLRLFQDEEFLAEEEISAWVTLLDARRRATEERGMAYRHLFVPDKLAVHPELFPSVVGTAPGARILARAGRGPLGDCLVDAQAALRAAKHEAPVYLRTDSHWTFEGCFAAYAALCRSLGVVPRGGLVNRPAASVTLAMDLGGKFSPPVVEEATFRSILYNARRVEANAQVAALEQNGFADGAGLLGGTRVVFRNDSPGAEPRVLVLFGDSYSEFRPHMLTGLLAETFREVHFVWSPSIDLGYAERVGANIVVSEMAERFVKRLPDDSRDVVAWADERMAARMETAA